MRTTEKQIKTAKEKLRYETPTVTSMDVELEEGIAAGSADLNIQKQWSDTDTQTKSVENTLW